MREAVAGTLGSWITDGTNWYLPVRDKYGTLYIGEIRRFVPGWNSRDNARPGWRWRLYTKEWKQFKLNKHPKLLRNDRYPLDKGDFVPSEDSGFGETLKGEVETAMAQYGVTPKPKADTTQPPPSAAALISATQDIPGVDVGDTSKRGVVVTYTLDDVTGASARADLQKRLKRNGFSGFTAGRYMGGGMAGFRGGPQKGTSASHDRGGRITADFSTSTYGGIPETYVKVRAEWGRTERNQ